MPKKIKIIQLDVTKNFEVAVHGRTIVLVGLFFIILGTHITGYQRACGYAIFLAALVLLNLVYLMINQIFYDYRLHKRRFKYFDSQLNGNILVLDRFSVYKDVKPNATYFVTNEIAFNNFRVHDSSINLLMNDINNLGIDDPGTVYRINGVNYLEVTKEETANFLRLSLPVEVDIGFYNLVCIRGDDYLKMRMRNE